MMNLIQKLMGRRQFLIAAGLTSGCALTCKKLAGYMDRNVQAGSLTAADQAMAATMKKAANRCPHLLSPLRIRHTVLKNRIMHTASPPHSLQGPENFPTAEFRKHYSNIARNAAIVTVDSAWGSYPQQYGDGNDMHRGTDHYADHIWQDIPPVHNYVRRLIDDIHCEGSLVRYIGTTGGGGGEMPSGGGGGGEMPSGGGGGQMPQGEMPEGMEMPEGGMQGGPQSGGQGGQMPEGMGQGGQMPEGGMQAGGGGQMPQGGGGMPGGGQQSTKSVEEAVAEAKEIEEQGFDVMVVNSTDIETIEAIRNQTKLILQGGLRVGGGGMGNNSILHKWDYEGDDLDWQYGENTPGITNVNHPSNDELEQAVEQAKKLAGLVDFVWIRDGRQEHPNDWIQDPDKPFNLYYAEAIKKAGVDLLVCPSAGFHDALQNDSFIANGQTDMVGMATPFFAEPEFVKKASEGRPEDILPCIQCHCCHGISRTHGPWFDTCTVSPKWGTPDYKLKNITAPTVTKTVAVVGGGIAGMKAAITAAERGHKVTLYEKDKALGGLLKFTDNARWKWNYKRLKDYFVLQTEKAGVDVKLNSDATPAMIKKKGYDTVLVATGAEPIATRMKGGDGSNVFGILESYEKKDQIKGDVVFIGAGRIGTESALGICKDGHKVTLLCTGTELIELKYIGSHNMMNQIAILQNHPDFNFVLNAMPTKISGGKVYYTDENGKEQSIKADTVVTFNGLKPKTDEAETFIGTADQVLFMGDCTGRNNGTIQKALRSAFFMASQV
jgi:2,4-dienoyl-CoA reductase-like NADH-dependent reductase (Old Yellow Enzyme family)/thioredoxin reductase